MTTETEMTLRELLADELDGSALDYGEIAERLAANLSEEDKHRYLVHGLRHRIAQWISAQRPPINEAPGPSRSARWDQVGEARDILEDWWVAFLDRSSKPLLDCSPGDLAEAAEWYEKRAAGYLARAEAYQTLARKLRRAKVSSPRDLDRQDVRTILNV